MSSDTWLFGFVSFVGSTLIAAVFVAGIVVTLRRWQVSLGSRLAAMGFLTLLVTLVAQQAFNLVQPFLFGDSDATAMVSRMLVVSACSTLLHVVGYALLVFGFGVALRELARLQAASFYDDLANRGDRG